MKRRPAGAVLVILMGSGLAGATVGMVRGAAAGRVAATVRVRIEEARRRDADIRFYAARVARDPVGAADRARLAALYLQRARETGDFADYRRAEQLARRSLALRIAHNTQAYVLLASALLAQHRFTEALAVARALEARDPGVPSHRALLAEVELELGRYDAARPLFDSLWPARHELAVAPRLARWAELGGDTARARRLLDAALATARQRPDLPAEQLAWFYLRVGDLALRYGRSDAAEPAIERGLAVCPGDYRLLAARARLDASRSRWRDAIAAGEQAIASVPDPATFGVISDAYAAVGDSASAVEYAHAMEIAVLGQPGQWHRAWSLFLLDHRRRVPEVLAKVRQELRSRRDVYGYDLLAWALHQEGRDAEARRAMRRALALGTLDPQLLRHAAEIGR